MPQVNQKPTPLQRLNRKILSAPVRQFVEDEPLTSTLGVASAAATGVGLTMASPTIQKVARATVAPVAATAAATYGGLMLQDAFVRTQRDPSAMGTLKADAETAVGSGLIVGSATGLAVINKGTAMGKAVEMASDKALLPATGAAVAAIGVSEASTAFDLPVMKDPSDVGERMERDGQVGAKIVAGGAMAEAGSELAGQALGVRQLMVLSDGAKGVLPLVGVAGLGMVYQDAMDRKGFTDLDFVGTGTAAAALATGRMGSPNVKALSAVEGGNLLAYSAYNAHKAAEDYHDHIDASIGRGYLAAGSALGGSALMSTAAGLSWPTKLVEYAAKDPLLAVGGTVLAGVSVKAYHDITTSGALSNGKQADPISSCAPVAASFALLGGLVGAVTKLAPLSVSLTAGALGGAVAAEAVCTSANAQ